MERRITGNTLVVLKQALFEIKVCFVNAGRSKASRNRGLKFIADITAFIDKTSTLQLPADSPTLHCEIQRA